MTRSVLLPISEITLRVSRSSGPGGQHAQKSSTRVEALFEVETSTTLTDTQKRRVVARAGPVLRAVAQDERSQSRNRELAVERLVQKLREALAVPRRRVATRPGKAAKDVGARASSGGHGRRRSGSLRPPNRLAAVDVLRLASLLPELPRERTRLLDNLGRVRREVGPITMELSDAVADHMNIRRGEVHEVVSFYSFLQVPTDAVRVCTGPVCDCFGARELLESTPGAIEVACLGHCDLAPAMTRGDEIVPAVTHSTNDGPAVGLGTRDTTLADYDARGGLSLLREAPSLERIVEELKSSGLTGYGGAGFPTGMKWEAVSREAGPRYVVVNADEGEPGTIKDRYVMELRPHLMLEATVLAMRSLDATEGLYLPPRGIRNIARATPTGARRVSRRGTARRAVARARRRRRCVHRG